MKRTNALEMRRNLGKVLRLLARDGEPIVVQKNREPAAVLISLRDYHERFVDKVAEAEREHLASEILAFRRRTKPSRQSVVELIRELRGPLP
jgi:prevent-host-death family protein